MKINISQSRQKWFSQSFFQKNIIIQRQTPKRISLLRCTNKNFGKFEPIQNIDNVKIQIGQNQSTDESKQNIPQNQSDYLTTQIEINDIQNFKEENQNLLQEQKLKMEERQNYFIEQMKNKKLNIFELIKNNRLNKKIYDQKQSQVPHHLQHDVNQAIQEPMNVVQAQNRFENIYPWLVLLIIIAIRVLYQWQRSIFQYSYGYKGVGDQKGNPIFEMSTSYPEMQQYFGFLTGFAYSIPFSIFGVYFGKITGQINRGLVLSLCMLASGATMSATGYFDSFTLMVILRVLLGLISSAFNPLSFSILAEIFPKEKRATINSILQSGNYIGWGLSSISILAIKQYGWRYTYQILGALALFIAIICSLAVKDPKQINSDPQIEKKQGNELEKKQSSLNIIKNNIVIKLVILGSFIRNIGGSVTTTYLPVFFLQNFPQFKDQYSFINSVVLSVLGMVSGIIAGIISDKFEKKSLLTKSWICMAGSIVALPLIALATLQTSHFYLSIICFSIFTLFSAAFSGSAITMLQNVSTKEQQGVATSFYFTSATIAQSFGPLICGFLENYFKAQSNPQLYGPIISAMVAFGFLGSTPIWYFAGKEYEKKMKELQKV